MALPKPNGGVRRIGVGELVRRLTGKSLMALVKEEARLHFWPAQVRVADKGGAEKAVHAVRAWTQLHAGSAQKVLVKLDFSNAFNCVRGSCPAAGLRQLPLVGSMGKVVQRPSCLQYGEGVLRSCSGVQPG